MEQIIASGKLYYSLLYFVTKSTKVCNVFIYFAAQEPSSIFHKPFKSRMHFGTSAT